MTNMTKTPGVNVALSVLIVLQLVMLASLFAGIPPHPPVATPLFGIAPFLAASLAVAVAALVLGDGSRMTYVLAVLAAVMAAVSFGPQKYFDAQFALIWPAVMAGQVAILTVLALAVKRWQDRAE